MLIKFYHTLLSKKESLSFLSKLKDSIIDHKENRFFNYSKEIKSLIDTYTFFKKIINNSKLKTDEDFINLYKEETEKNKNIQINILKSFCLSLE